MTKKKFVVYASSFFFVLDDRGAFSLPVLHNWQGLTSHGTLIISDKGLKH